MINEKYVLNVLKPKIENNKINRDSVERCFINGLQVNEEELKEVYECLAKNKIEVIDDFNFYDDDSAETEDETFDIKDIRPEDADYDLEQEFDFSSFEDSAKDEEEYKKRIKYYQKNYKNLSNERLCALVNEGDDRAKEFLYYKNIKLIKKYAGIYMTYYGHDLEFDDLVQLGTMGFFEAVSRFDQNKGTKLSTYAVWWIEQKIVRGILDNGFTIRIPVHMMEKINKVTKANRDLYNKKGKEASSKEIAKYYNEIHNDKITAEEAEQCLEYRKNYLNNVSLDAPIKDDGDDTLIDFVSYNSIETPEEYIEKMCLHDEINKILDNFDDREKDVIIRRFGLKDGKEETLEEIGKIYGVTRERIRQIEAKVLRKMKTPKYKQILKEMINND